MAYSLKNTRNTEIDTVANNTLKVTTFGIRIPGKNFSGYGEAIAQSLLHMLEHHAAPNTGGDLPNPSNPAVDLSNPVEGQLWYDTTNRKLRVWDSVDVAWNISSGAAALGTTPPSGPTEGDLWWNNTAGVDQLFGWDGANWQLVGSDSRAGNINRTVDLEINTGGTGGLASGDGVSPTAGTNSQAVGLLIANILVGVWSNTAVATPAYYYRPLNDGSGNVRYYTFDPFGALGILKGLNVGENTSSFWFNGKSKSAETADQLAGISSSDFMRRDNGAGADTSRQPGAASLNMGTTGNRWGTIFGTTFDGEASTARYGDLAERYHADELMEEGDVVKIGGVNEITKTSFVSDEDVFGVVSNNPGFGLNVDAGKEDTHPFVALAGRIPVKVTGIVSKGQRLVSSNVSGVAQVASTPAVFQVIGRALENKTTEGIELIEVVVGAK